MKRIILSAVAALAIFAIGCNKKGGDPKTVLSAFFEALSKKDIDAAKKYATKESASMLDMMKMGMTNSTDKKDNEYDKENMEFGDSKIDGDKAFVPVKDKKSGETTNFKLLKEGGDWKVAFDKASMMEMAGEKMKGMNQGTGDSTLNSVPMDSMPSHDDMMNMDSTHTP